MDINKEFSELKRWIMRLFIFIITLSLVTSACSEINKYFSKEDDHFLEESAEAIIDRHLGVDIDLTPISPE